MLAHMRAARRGVDLQARAGALLLRGTPWQPPSRQKPTSWKRIGHEHSGQLSLQPDLQLQAQRIEVRHRSVLVAYCPKQARKNQTLHVSQKPLFLLRHRRDLASKGTKPAAGKQKNGELDAGKEENAKSATSAKEEPKSDAGIMEQAKSAAQERPENPKPRRRSRRKSAAAAKEEEAILATASTKESKSAAVAKEEAKSAAVAKEKAKSAAAAKEEAKSAAVAKEKAKSAAASTKESKSATVAKEEAKSAAATKENAKSAAAAKEEAKSATVAKEEAKSAAATKEKAKPAAAAKEEAKSAAASTKESKSAAVAKEESKSAATAKEEAKSAAAAKEEAKSAAAAKEEAKSAAAAKEKAKSAAASTKESKSATVAKEEAKSAAATKENAKSAAAAKEEAKSAAAAKEEAKSAAAAKEEAKPAAAAKEEANTSGKVASTAGKEASASQKNIWNDDVFGDFSSTLPIIKPSPICVLLEELKKTKSTIADLRQLVFAQVSSIDKQITHLADVEDRHLQNASVHYMDAILGKFQTPNHVAAPPSVQSATPTLVESRSESPEVANESSTPSPLSHFSSETPLKPSKSMPESPQRSLQRSPEARVDPRAPKAVVSGATASSSMLSWEVDSNGEPLAISPSTSGGFDVWTIETESAAHELMTRIKALPPDIAILGCDTEVIIDIKNTSPVGNGVVTCVSIAFPTLEDFTQVHTNENDLAKNFPSIANGEAKLRLPPKRLCAWIDVMGDGAQHDPMGLLKIIAPALEAKTSPRKVWHNYSFDRHVLFNHNVDCHGLAGDTMHMGRLTHNGRIEGYSLAALSQKFLETPDLGKTPMLDLFGRPKILASGKPGKSLELPPIDEIQVGEKRDQWIAYSCLDSVACLKLYFTFRQTLETMFIDKEESAVPKSLFQVYEENLLPFAHVLTEMEREGIQIDVEHLENIAVQSKADLEENMAAFRNWVRESDALVNPDDADNINLNSPKQRAALIHGPKSMGENADIIELPGLKKKTTVQFRGLGLPVIAQTATEQPKTGAGQLQALAGDVTRDPPRWGIAYETLEEKNPGAGEAACLGLSKLTTSLAIEKLIGTFIEPLIQRAKSDVERRVHTSLNFNTDTGRLSASNPNLQNQPALEKDIYKIRKAFTCRPGNRLIVADYGQLELRVLAHLANCKSMIDAFIAGGDFHSRTALSMFDHIANDKEVILEWDKAANGNEPPPYPLIKDKYASERRQAKVLNFSIAYGKTAFGLANDFGVSVDEAQAIVDRWYNARPEVREWQKETIEFCRDHGYVETIWGRRRPLEKINSSNTSLRRASERAAINTPIQGSAADIVMSAMNKLYANQAFRDLGWRMILQVHDEIIAEGPEESTKEAMEILRECMENPLDYVLGVDMIVDADAANDWYEAK